MTLTLLMTFGHIQRINKLKWVKILFFLIWPWPWPNELDTQTWPRYGQDVPAYQKWSFYVKGFKSYSLNRQTEHRHTDRHTDRQTDRHDRKHYLPAYAGGNNVDWCWVASESWFNRKNVVQIFGLSEYFPIHFFPPKSLSTRNTFPWLLLLFTIAHRTHLAVCFMNVRITARLTCYKTSPVEYQ